MPLRRVTPASLPTTRQAFRALETTPSKVLPSSRTEKAGGEAEPLRSKVHKESAAGWARTYATTPWSAATKLWADHLLSSPHLGHAFILRQVPVGHEETIILVLILSHVIVIVLERKKHNDNVWKHVLYL